MRLIPFLCLSLLVGCDEAIVRVSPSGDDANAGTASAPLKTLTAARDAVRAMKAKGVRPEKGWTVELADGVYPLAEPLSLGPEDADVEWRAAHAGKAVLTGLVALEDLTPETDPQVLERLPAEAHGKVLRGHVPGTGALPSFVGGGEERPNWENDDPVQLFQGGRRLPCARWPNDEYAQAGDPLGKRFSLSTSFHVGHDGIFRYDSPRLENWTKESDLWTFGLWVYDWDDRRNPVTKVDCQEKSITLGLDPRRGTPIRRGGYFYVFNALCELDRPGEWTVDRANRTVEVWPDGETAPTVALTKHLLVCTTATNLVFRGIVFEGARGDAVVVRDSEDVRFVASTVRRVGGWGVRTDGGRRCRVVGCDLFDLGKGGIRLDGGDRDTMTRADHVADNCHVHHYGILNPNYHSGVYLDGVGNAATHNLLHHTPHQGVFFNGNDHLIAYNVIHDACQFNDDAGAIYACGQRLGWCARGTVIEHNLIHFVGKKPYTQHTDGIYLDDWTSGVIVRGNIVNRTCLGVHVGGGNFVTVTNNLFITGGRSVNIGSRGIDSFGKHGVKDGRKGGNYKKLLDQCHRSKVFRSHYPELETFFAVEDDVFAGYPLFNRVTDNAVVATALPRIYKESFLPKWDTVTNNHEFAGTDLTDYRRLDFRPRPGSALAASFRGHELRYDEMGLYPSPDRASPAVKFGEDVTYMKGEPRRIVSLPESRIDIVLQDPLPAGVSNMAECVSNCFLPPWGKGRRVCTEKVFPVPLPDRWQECVFTFVPRFDCRVLVDLMGNYGEKALYDDIRITGAELKDGGFERGPKGPWRLNATDPATSKVRPPWGVIPAPEDHPAAEGRFVASINHDRQLVQMIRLKKGVPVTVSFKSRAFIPAE